MPIVDSANNQSNQPPPAPANKPKKILLVEDDNNLADVYINRLEAEGFEVTRVEDGEQALSAAVKYRPDLVLLDIMMPKVSGYDVLDILRNTPATANLKIIMVTARGQDADRERASKLGADDYLVKSQVIIADLVDRVKEHLGVE
jgi:DNA-binding response OmpR family regulator